MNFFYHIKNTCINQVRLLTGCLAVCLILSSCSAGGSGNPPDPAASVSAGGSTSGTAVTLNMVLVSMGTNLTDASMVEGAINAHLGTAADFLLRIEWVEMTELADRLNLKLSNGDPLDIMILFDTDIASFYARNALMPLDELIREWGPDIVQAVGEDYLRSGRIGGKQVAIPSVKAYACIPGFIYRSDLAGQYGIDMSTVHSIRDLTPVFEKLHRVAPELTLVVSSNPDNPMFQGYAWDKLGDQYGVLMDPCGSTQVSDLYETEMYAQLVILMHQWYEAGYVQPDAALTADNLATLLGAGNAFGAIYTDQPGELAIQSAAAGYPLAFAAFDAALSTTSNVATVNLAIPVSSTHPKEAMECINLLYKDADLINLLYYGIEGVHYQLTDPVSGTVDYPEGVNMMTSGYVQMLRVGNQLLAYTQAQYPEDYHGQIRQFNASANRSLALGFSYDAEDVSDILLELDRVCAKYRRGLECGMLDPQTELPKFISELKAAGISRVIRTKQAQLDAWMAGSASSAP